MKYSHTTSLGLKLETGRTMLDKLYRLSMFAAGILLLLMVVLTAVIGADEMVLRIVGWITVVPILSSLSLFIAKNVRK